METSLTHEPLLRAALPGHNNGRRWCIPPAILREPTETLEASQLLEECRGELGLLLWQSLRDVTLWAAVPAADRGGLFSPAAAAARMALLRAAAGEPAVEVPLTTLAALVGDPASATPAVVTLVCREVSRWAEGRGAGETALAYAQAGALASPNDATAAFAVGSLALRWRKLARAETWLRRAIGLARRAEDWLPYAESYVELGELHARRGNPMAARRFLFKSLRAARRHSLLAVRGRALHTLFHLSVEAGVLDEAERFARGAMRAYGRRNPRLPQLVYDISSLWVGRENYGRAIPMLQKLLPMRPEARHRAVTLALLARAAAGAGERKTMEEAWNGAWGLLRTLGDDDAALTVLADLARAAALVKDWERMEQAARHAVAAATRRGEAHLPADVERLMGSLREQVR